jgi:beta,beta-carotene 9',10'-dioxygenase
MGRGLAKGFETLEEEKRIDSLPVEGEIPGWLDGSLLRTGPARWEVGGRRMSHWFDGFAMLHRFAFSGGTVSYANRYLESKAYRSAEETGEITYSEFATDPCRSLFKRVTSLLQGPQLSDNGNVNLVKLGQRFVAMTETPIPVEFDAATLATAGVAWDTPGLLTTAHPHLDRSNGGMINFATRLGRRNEYRFFGLGPDAPGDQTRVLASLPVRHPAYMHSFGQSERWFVLAEFPFVVNPLALALSGRPYIENYRWKPERGTKLTLIDRRTGEATGPFVTDACFGFHHVNAYEDGETVIADICTFDDPAIVEDLYLGNLRNGGRIAPPHLDRFTIESAAGTATRERLVEEPLDLPRINYGRCHERRHRYVWGAGTDGTGFFDRIVRVDVEERTAEVWAEPCSFPGEPVFVAAPDAAGESDGVLLSVVLDGEAGTSYLLVLEAETLSEVGRARVPHHVPLGFHGQYARF